MKKKSNSYAELKTIDESEVTISSMFSSTTCYDLMPVSRKGVVFETSISFQLAFFSLIEHDTEIAALWDPSKVGLVALMSIEDYIQALLVCRANSISMMELASRSIADMLLSPALTFRNPEYRPVDAEDSVMQLCMHIHRQGLDYAPVIDPETNSLVAILGYHDLVHFLSQCSIQFPRLFESSVGGLGILNPDYSAVPSSAMLCDVATLLHSKRLLGAPVVDATTSKVIGVYYISDFSFVIRAADPDAVLTSLCTLTMGEALKLSSESQENPDQISGIVQVMVVCSMEDAVGSVLQNMMQNRSTLAVAVGANGCFLGVVTIKDLIQHFLSLS